MPEQTQDLLTPGQRRFQDVMNAAPAGLRQQLGMVGSMVNDMIRFATPADADLVRFQMDMCGALELICREKLQEFGDAPES